MNEVELPFGGTSVGIPVPTDSKDILPGLEQDAASEIMSLFLRTKHNQTVGQFIGTQGWHFIGTVPNDHITLQAPSGRRWDVSLNPYTLLKTTANVANNNELDDDLPW